MTTKIWKPKPGEWVSAKHYVNVLVHKTIMIDSSEFTAGFTPTGWKVLFAEGNLFPSGGWANPGTLRVGGTYRLHTGQIVVAHQGVGSGNRELRDLSGQLVMSYKSGQTRHALHLVLWAPHQSEWVYSNGTYLRFIAIKPFGAAQCLDDYGRDVTVPLKSLRPTTYVGPEHEAVLEKVPEEPETAEPRCHVATPPAVQHRCRKCHGKLIDVGGIITCPNPICETLPRLRQVYGKFRNGVPVSLIAEENWASIRRALECGISRYSEACEVTEATGQGVSIYHPIKEEAVREWRKKVEKLDL